MNHDTNEVLADTGMGAFIEQYPLGNIQMVW